MNTLARRQRAPYKSDRHFVLSEFATTQFASTQPPDLLPTPRQIINSRTHDRVYEPVTYGAAIERPAPKTARRLREIGIGLAVAFVVAVALAAIFYSRATP